MSYNKIGTLASGIYYTEFDNLTGAAQISGEIQSVSGWLQQNIGMLNSLINTSFSGEDPNWLLEEPNIYSQIYLGHYYRKKSRDTLRGIDESADFITLREGDTVITRTNKNEIAKTYLSLAKESEEALKDLIYKYNAYNSSPIQVAGRDGNLD